MRIGVIGCGGMGTTHYLSLKVLSEKEDDVEVVALSDCRKEFLDKAASYFPEAGTDKGCRTVAFFISAGKHKSGLLCFIIRRKIFGRYCIKLLRYDRR